MELLTFDDYRAILDLLALLRRPYRREELARLVLPPLVKLLGADIASYHEVNPATRVVTGFIEPDKIDFDMLARALHRYMEDHPIIAHIQKNGADGALRLSDFIPRNEWHDTGLYQELYRPLGMEYQIILTLPARKPLIAALVFSRRHTDFTERDRTVLNILRPQLTGALEAARIAWRLRKNLQRRHGALENLPQGVVLLNGTGRIEMWTQKARLWLGRYFPGPAPSLTDLPEEISSWLRRQLFPGNNLHAESPVLSRRRGEDQLTVRLICTPEKRRLLVLSESRALTSARPLETMGLSPRQAETLLHLTRGLTNEQIARNLHISSRTVQKHLEAVFTILKVTSRTAASCLALDRLHMVLIAAMLLGGGIMDSLSLC